VPKPNRRTKIVCTLGPAVDSKAKIKSLIDAGMNVARINCSHGDWAQRKQWIKWITELQPKVAPVGILVDLQGPKVRIGKLDKPLHLKPGTPVTVSNKADADLKLPDAKAFDSIHTDDRLLLGDTGLALEVIERKGAALLCKAASTGIVTSNMGVTIADRAFDIAPITDQDKKDLKEALDLNADFIALSYVRRPEDITNLKKLLSKHNNPPKVVAKIETRDAIKHLEDIVDATDVVMVARGDLGLQMSLEEVPIAQKRIIAACNATATPVITATQMLESMIHAQRPTRAEASDVANAILDGTDAVMLSGETAVGDYPIDAVKTMAAIAHRAEAHIDGTRSMRRRKRTAKPDTETDSVALAAVGISQTLHTAAILTSTTSGMTPRLVSRYRPEAQILCVCWNPATQRQLSVVWGVEAACAKLPKGTDAAVAATIATFQKLGRIKFREKVVVTAGVPAGVPGNTNMILVLDV
jgi:pyruvate kinase